MSGLFLLAIVGLWMWFAFKTSKVAGSWIAQGRWRWPVAALLFVVLLPLPVADELVAKHQINALCREGAGLRIDEQRIKGRRVRVAYEPLNAEVPGVAIPVTFSKLVLRDADTGEDLGSRGHYVVKGGWLIRTLSFSESSSPLTTESYCAPGGEGAHEAAARLGFKIIN